MPFNKATFLVVGRCLASSFYNHHADQRGPPIGTRCENDARLSSLFISFLGLVTLLGLLMAAPVLANSPPAETLTKTPAPASLNADKLHDLINTVALQEGVDPGLLRAMVATESRFNSRSVSNKGAVGLMQLMPATARELGVSNRFNPEQNLRGGARYLRRMMDRFPNDLNLALAAYNAGPGNVVRFRGIPPFPETRRYIAKVMANYAKTVPGLNQSPKRINRYRKPNGTVVLTNARHIRKILRQQKSSRSVTIREANPYVNIRRTEYKTHSKRSLSGAKGSGNDIYEGVPVIRLTRR